MQGQNNCQNIDFESGTIENWVTTGDVLLVNQQQTDHYGNFNLSLSGNYAVKLGNNVAPNSQIPNYSAIKRTITITQSNKYLMYGYAIVLLGYPHANEDAAFVELTITNTNGDTIPCTHYLAYAQSSVGNDFQLSNKPLEANLAYECCYPIYFQPWKMNAVDLSPYVGQTLTFTLKSDWCRYDVDWGYAYADFYCSSQYMNSYYDCTVDAYRIETIPGYNNYTWSGPGITSGQGTNAILVNQDGIYTVSIPNPVSTCPSTQISTVFNAAAIDDKKKSDFSFNNPTCVNDSIYFTNLSKANPPITNNQWDFGDGSFAYETNPAHLYFLPGNYWVSLYTENNVGCIDSIKKLVKIESITLLDIGSNLEHCDGENLTIQIVNPPNDASFIWSNGKTGSSISVHQSGNYWVKSINTCAKSDTIAITENPAFMGEIPNVFTPNKDGVNELYFISSFDVTEFLFSIFDRWGNLIFSSPDPDFQWNAIHNDLPFNDGTYFYTMRYRLSCQTESILKNGFITIVR